MAKNKRLKSQFMTISRKQKLSMRTIFIDIIDNENFDFDLSLIFLSTVEAEAESAEYKPSF